MSASNFSIALAIYRIQRKLWEGNLARGLEPCPRAAGTRAHQHLWRPPAHGTRRCHWVLERPNLLSTTPCPRQLKNYSRSTNQANQSKYTSVGTRIAVGSMRRGARTVLPSEPPSPQKQQTPNAGLAERARAAPALAKLVVLGILAMGMYVALLALEERSEIGPITGDDPVNGLSPSEGLKRGYRQLKMMGFESEGGTGGGWKTCRRFEEKDLAPHKKVGLRFSAEQTERFFSVFAQQQSIAFVSWLVTNLWDAAASSLHCLLSGCLVCCAAVCPD